MNEDYGYVVFTGNDCVPIEADETGASNAALKRYAENISKMEVKED